jgi:hypothetical protein
LSKGAWRLARVMGLTLAVLAAAAPGARGQSIGLGVRLTSVSGSDSVAVDPSVSVNNKFTGGFVRFNLSKRMTFEAAMDYQTSTNPTGTARIRNTPIQLSGLIVPFRTPVQPYFLAGVGWYKHKLEALDQGKAVMTTDTTDFGYHTGVGGLLMFGKHASAYVDYRYTWVDVNGVEGLMGAVRTAVSLTSVLGAMTGANSQSNSGTTPSISRRGSMWTGGLAVYF